MNEAIKNLLKVNGQPSFRSLGLINKLDKASITDKPESLLEALKALTREIDDFRSLIFRTADALYLREEPKGYTRLWRTTDQSIGTGAYTSINLDSEIFDVDSIHSLSANTSRITFPRDGFYAFGGQIRFASNVTGTRRLRFLKNNAGNGLLQLNEPAHPTEVHDLTAASFDRFSAGDFLEMQAFQSSGVALNVLTLSGMSPIFWALLVREDRRWVI